MALLALQEIAVAYNKQRILKDLTLEVEKGQLVSLLGPSGCGKTTTLRLIAGLVQASEGKVLYNEKDYTKVPVTKRNVGFVFQNYILFPHMTIFHNIAFGLRLRKCSKMEIEKRVMDVLEIVNMSGFEMRYPHELSGGQKQRIAIARAIVIEPDILLFDEPLSNLDANLRVNMRTEIRRIQQNLGITTVYVSHDQEECLAISDQVAIMNQGAIEQFNSPAAIYNYPRTKFVADFIGYKNFISFDERNDDGDHIVLIKSGYVFVLQKDAHMSNLTGKTGTIRPDALMMQAKSPSGNLQHNCLPGRIKVRTYLGRSYQYSVGTPFGDFIVNREMTEPYYVGQEIVLVFPKNQMVLVD
ncbi:ABC transporter ATP-binding protein [Peribacillus sp. NPDC097264]|uniref:ABC transporter ATP-binding protein n=1 Tax=Peribacillus sp. NPDC097264 TaxID=3390616 RepID=UPI003CFDB44E